MPEEPNGPTVSLSLTFKGGAEALAFYKKAFGATEVFRMDEPDGSGIAHAEFMIGNTKIYLSNESPEWGAKAMPEGATASCCFSILVEECDAAHAKALEAGATSISEPEDKFWGGRSSVIRDPFGYRWSFVQITEQLTEEEISRRAQELYG